MLSKRVTISYSTRLSMAAFVLQVPLGVLLLTLGLSEPRTAFVCATAALPMAILTAAYLGLRQFDLFSPLFGVGVSVLFGTSLRTLYFAFSSSPRASEILDGDGVPSLMAGVVIVSLGIGFLVLGYVVAGRCGFDLSRWVGQSNVWSRKRLVVLGLVVTALSLFCTIDRLGRTGFDVSDLGSLQNMSAKRRVAVPGSGQHLSALGYHSWAAEILPAFMLYAWLATGRQPGFRGSRPWVLWFLALTLLSSFVASSRMPMCVALLNVMIVLYYQRLLSLKVSLVGGSAIIAILSSVLLIRTGEFTTETNPLTLGPQVVVDTVVGNENFVDILRVTRMYRSVPDVLRYKYGQSFVTWVVSPIPRVWWVGKPPISQGHDISREVYGVSYQQSDRPQGGGRPPGFIGELIWNFGVFAVPVGTLIYGACLRLFHNSMRPFLQSSPFALLLYVGAYLPLSFIVIGGDFSRAMMMAIQGVVTTCVIVAFLSRR